MQLGITSQHHKSSLIGQNCLSFLKGLLSKLKITTRALAEVSSRQHLHERR